MGAAAGGAYRANVTAVLQTMQSLNMTVMRTWAFKDGPNWQGLQTAPNVYDERVFRRFPRIQGIVLGTSDATTLS